MSPKIKLESKLMGVIIISMQRNGVLAPDPCGKITRRLLDICNMERTLQQGNILQRSRKPQHK